MAELIDEVLENELEASSLEEEKIEEIGRASCRERV